MHPLSKLSFGPLGEAKLHIKLSADLGSGAVNDAYVVKQVGTARFMVSDGTHEMVCKLVVGPTPLNPGEAVLTVTPHGAAAEYAKVVYSKTVVTFEGHRYHWILATSTIAGQTALNCG